MDDFGAFVLAPGLRVVRRGVNHLQIGLYAGRRALLPRTPDVEGTLAALLERRPFEPGPEGRAALETLQEHGCLVAADEISRRSRRLSGSRVSLLGDLAGARDLLERAGVRVVAAHSEADVVLVGGPGEGDRDRPDPLPRRGPRHPPVRPVDGAAAPRPLRR